MTEHYDNPEIDALFERYRVAPTSHVFAPLADACRKVGLVEEALEICEKGVDANPAYASGHVVRGKCYVDQGDIDEAEVSFQRVLDLDPNNLVALKFLGMILVERGDADGAREQFKHILALDPENKEIRLKLEELEPETSNAYARDDASDEVTELRDVPEDDFEGATIDLGRKTETPDEMATITLADIYASQGYTGKALKIYREVAKQQPENSAIREKIRRLEGKSASAFDATGDPDIEIDTGFVDIPTPNERSRRANTAPDMTETAEITLDDEPVSAPKTEPAADPAMAASTEEPATPKETNPGATPMEESRSYEQFKRWLKNLSE